MTESSKLSHKQELKGILAGLVTFPHFLLDLFFMSLVLLIWPLAFRDTEVSDVAQ